MVRFVVITATSFATMLVNVLRRRMKTEGAASAKVLEFAAQFEKEFSLASVETSIDSSIDYHDTWIVDNGSTSHMSGKYGVFQRIEEISLGHFVETNIGNPRAEIKGVGTVKFQLDLGENLEINRVLFVPGMNVSRLSMSSLEDDGYGLFVKTRHIFL